MIDIPINKARIRLLIRGNISCLVPLDLVTAKIFFKIILSELTKKLNGMFHLPGLSKHCTHFKLFYLCGKFIYLAGYLSY